jgi:hypothetical protein
MCQREMTGPRIQGSVLLMRRRRSDAMSGLSLDQGTRQKRTGFDFLSSCVRFGVGII